MEKWEIVTRTEDEGSAILPDIAEAINGKLEQHGIEKEQVLGIGVGVPAPVTVDGIVNGSANLGWKYKNAKKELEELTGLTANLEMMRMLPHLARCGKAAVLVTAI